MNDMRIFDVVVVGGGPTGEEAAARLSDRGLQVALVEDRLIGGECAHWACIPSKALLRPPEVLAEAGRIPGVRESLDSGPHVAAVLGRRDEVIGVDAGTGKPGDGVLMPWVESHRITLVRGRGRLTGERRVTVAGEELEARQAVVLSGGSEPLLPRSKGSTGSRGVWTNREATPPRRYRADSSSSAPGRSAWRCRRRSRSWVARSLSSREKAASSRGTSTSRASRSRRPSSGTA